MKRASLPVPSALGLADSQGLTIHELTAANASQIVPGLLLDPSVKEEVLDATAKKWGAELFGNGKK